MPSRRSEYVGIRTRLFTARVGRFAALALAGVLAACRGSATRVGAGAPAPTPTEARIVAIDHVTFLVSDLARSRTFYMGLLGLPEASTPTPPCPRAPQGHAAFAVNATQFIVLEEGPVAEDGRLGHVAFARSGVVDIPSAAATSKDPDGHTIEFVAERRSPPVAAIAGAGLRLAHVGVLVHSLAASQSFYGERLGFQEVWRGGGEGRLDWVNLRVPGGNDYLELMLYDQLPPPDARGGKNHVCLFVPDVTAALATIQARPERAAYQPPLEIRVGRNGKRQLNLFDPDGNRVELMEPSTVDGKPVPSSTAPPPRP